MISTRERFEDLWNKEQEGMSSSVNFALRNLAKRFYYCGVEDTMGMMLVLKEGPMDKEYEEYLREKNKVDLYPKRGQEVNFLLTIEGVELEVHAPYCLDDDGRLSPDPFYATVTLPGNETDLSPILDSRVLDTALGEIPYHE